MATFPAAHDELLELRGLLLSWYASSHRDLPWRGTVDPYAVLVSEVMLQQTQASRVAARFGRFLARFPTATSLAAAPTADVLAEWSGLGYNRRALSLRAAAQVVTRDGWPTTVEGLNLLPGVGAYTARAVASLAFGVPVGVVDTNVRRWLVRRMAAADTPRDLQALADRLAASEDRAEVAAWTHATMEFGARICRARDPVCGACPIRDGCPSRDVAARVAVTRQPPLRGSDRAYRGAVVRLLAASPRHVVDETELRDALATSQAELDAVLDDARWERIVGGLESDGLAHRDGRVLRLGEATIGR